MLTIDSVIMMHHGSNKAADSMTVIVGLMNHMPDGIYNVAGYGDIALADFNLEVAQLSIKCRWHLWHGEVGKQPHTINLNIAAKTDGTNDSSWTEEHDSTRRDVSFDKVDVNMYLTANKDS